MDIVELFLVGLPLPILVACVVWFVRFITSQQKRERLTLKWRDMDPVRRTLAGIIFVWIFLNLYLAIANELALLNVTDLPFNWIYSLARPALDWGSTATIVSLVFFFQLRFPRRPVVT